MQCLMYFPTTQYVGHTRKHYYGRHQNYAFLSKIMVIYIEIGAMLDFTNHCYDQNNFWLLHYVEHT